MPKPIMIYFDFDKTKFKIDPQTEDRIAEFKSWLGKYPGSMLSVTGHSDIVGTPEYNEDLAFQRAQIIVKYLEEQGIATARITTLSKGEAEAVVDYITPEGRARNRNAEISIKMK
jgi:outer membrane protein OmpA-like peptidoglycan-associated protein